MNPLNRDQVKQSCERSLIEKSLKFAGTNDRSSFICDLIIPNISKYPVVQQLRKRKSSFFALKSDRGPENLGSDLRRGSPMQKLDVP
jgi:hypothetical protein